LNNSNLSGVILGLTLTTAPEDIYRALIEATAFGTKKIVETYESSGIVIRDITAAGGMPQKNPFLMQVYADVLNKPIFVAGTAQACAVGSAIYAAVAAGESRGGHRDVASAVAAMARESIASYDPIPENVAVYEKLYREYEILHDYFGRGGNDVMMRLHTLKKDVQAREDQKT